MVLTDEARAALATASDILVVDPDLDLLEALLDARQAAEPGGTCRVLVTEEVADRLGYEFVLGTRVEGRRQRGSLHVRRTPDPPGTLIATPDAAFAVAGPSSSQTLLSTTERAAAVRTVLADEFATAQPADLGLPGREFLVASADRTLSAGFAADLDAALDGTDRLHRSADVNVLTLLVALGARQGHLFGALRTWADEVGVAPRQLFSDEKRTLVERGLIETIKLPLGEGHPRSRLRLTDDVLADCAARDFTEQLAERLHEAGDAGPAASSEREPVWKRPDRTAGPD